MSGQDQPGGLGSVYSVPEVDVHEYQVGIRCRIDKIDGFLAGRDSLHAVAVLFEGHFFGQRDKNIIFH